MATYPEGKRNVATTVSTPSHQPASYRPQGKGTSFPQCTPQTHEDNSIQPGSTERNQRLDRGCRSKQQPPSALQMLSLAFLVLAFKMRVGGFVLSKTVNVQTASPLSTVTSVSPEHSNEDPVFKLPPRPSSSSLCFVFPKPRAHRSFYRRFCWLLVSRGTGEISLRTLFYITYG